MKGKKVERVELVVAAAHELKAPLALIRHMAAGLVDPDLNNIEKQEYIERILLTSERMLRLTNQITSSSRLNAIENLNLLDSLEPVNVNVICEQALHEMLPLAKKFSQTLQVRQKRRQNLVLANKLVLHDIIVNLIDNSIKHNPTGGKIVLSTNNLAETVRLNLLDEGEGLSKAELNQLAQTVGRMPQPFSSRSGTSGLGLYIAGQLTFAMGGSIGLGKPKNGFAVFVDLLKSKQLRLVP